MRKLFLPILALVFSLPVFLGNINTASAQFNPLKPVCDSNTSDASVCNADGSNPLSGEGGIILNVVRLLGWAVGIASVFMIILAGLRFITASGDPNSIASARNTIIYALVGIVIFVSAQLLVSFVLSRI